MIQAYWKAVCIHCLEPMGIEAEQDKYDLPDTYMECGECGGTTNLAYGRLSMKIIK